MAQRQVISLKKEEEEQKKLMKKIYIFLGIGCIMYYLVPFILYATTGGNIEDIAGMMFMLLLGVYPFYVFIASFICTRYHGFKWFIPILFSAYFLPAALLFFGITAVPYILVYAVFGYFGSLGANLIVRRMERIKAKKEKASHEQREKATKRGRKKN